MTRLTEREARDLGLLTVKPNKFNAQKTTLDEIEFHSKKEADYYAELLILQKAGEVTKIELQPAYELVPEQWHEGRKIQPVTYIADFRVTCADGRVVVVDTKGHKTQLYRVKKKLLLWRYPGIDFLEV